MSNKYQTDAPLTTAGLRLTVPETVSGGAATAAARSTGAPGIMSAAVARPVTTYSAADRDGLSTGKLTIRSVIGLDLSRDFARMPLHRATVDGQSVW